MPTVLEAIKMFGEKSGLNEDECALAVDLYKVLNHNPESAEGLLKGYFEKHKKEYKEEQDYDKDLEEYIEYFGVE